MRIALVDDCPNDLSIMHQFLAEALDTDSVITEFHNGEDFLQHWSADTFDLIVLDIYMERDRTGHTGNGSECLPCICHYKQ
jgi:DNA-binding NarL/FixJ family response regulator